MLKFEVDEKEFVFRKPVKNEVIIYQDELIKGEGSLSLLMEKFLRQLFSGENVEEFAKLLDEKPLLVPRILSRILKDLGGEENFTEVEM